MSPMTHPQLRFRVATPDDAPRIQQLVEAAFRAEDSRPNWTADMALGRNFRIDIKFILPPITNPNGAVILACDNDDTIVASVEVSKHSADLARLAMLAVDQSYQRGGLGRRVLSYAEDYCRRTWDVKKIGLNALSTRKELLAWYGRCGYRETGEKTPFKQRRDDDTGAPDGLYFVEMEKDITSTDVC